jgi:hypothetical protein
MRKKAETKARWRFNFIASRLHTRRRGVLSPMNDRKAGTSPDILRDLRIFTELI